LIKYGLVPSRSLDDSMLKLIFHALMAVNFLVISSVDAAFPDDFSDVTWIDPNISSWAQTSRLTVDVRGADLIVDHTKKGIWPVRNHSVVGTCCNASIWVFIRHDGRWYASTFEYLRPNQTVKKVVALGGTHIKRPPFLTSTYNWRPSNGQVYGFMVSGYARFNLNDINVRARSNVFLYRWGVGPTDNINVDNPEPDPEPPIEPEACPPPEPEVPDPVDPPTIEYHNYVGTAIGAAVITGTVNESLTYSQEIAIRVGDDRSLEFTVDDQSFTTVVGDNNVFSGQFQIDLLNGTCNVPVSVTGSIVGNQASGSASGSDQCLLSSLNFSATFNANSKTTPKFLTANKTANKDVPKACAAQRLSPIISILLED